MHDKKLGTNAPKKKTMKTIKYIQLKNNTWTNQIKIKWNSICDKNLLVKMNEAKKKIKIDFSRVKNWIQMTKIINSYNFFLCLKMLQNSRGN